MFCYVKKKCDTESKIEKPVHSLPIKLPDNYDLYDTIKYYRIKKGYTIEGIGNMVNVSRDTIMIIENQKQYYNVNVLRNIIELLDIETIAFSKMDDYLKFLYLGGQAHVKDIRQKLGLTQCDFAKQIGVSRGSIKDWERGKKEISRISWGKLISFCKNKSINDLSS